MSGSQRYERIAVTDNTDHLEGPHSPSNRHATSSASYDQHHSIPNSPPPSFRSRASSPTHNAGRKFLEENDPLHEDAERTMNDAFDSPSGDDDSGDEDDADADTRDRRRLISSPTSPVDTREAQSQVERRVMQIPAFAPTTGGVFGGGGGNDGVFANLSAKPSRGDQGEDEKPPSYEQAAADATPPYWETTILAHPGFSSHEVYVDGLPVGSVFSFLWNAMISMSFQVVGFLLTYLLHTTHAAKNGSRAGLGFTLVQYGFGMRGTDLMGRPSTGDGSDPTADLPSDPNSHDFDPNAVGGSLADAAAASGSISSTDWLAYTLMIVGWFILIRSVSDFYRARRHELLVLQSPDRGLGTAVVAEGEGERAA